MADNKNNANSVDQIRDILFGEQTKNIEKRFAQLEAEINKQFNGIKNKMEALDKQLSQNLATLEKQSNQGLDHLSADQNERLAQLEQQLKNTIIDTEASILSELQQKTDALDENLTHRKELASLLKKMADQIAG
ncbi:hypothetical protein ACFODZ_10940 [Marinicella sediminis]|uniref:Uncharacterized protein n=1 Tax=Marinicella sediminis TaxID=1792834 RepID=A0ABV7J9W6_9GAMM|nr:hypothetical protein [Marinicella sediminis]